VQTLLLLYASNCAQETVHREKQSEEQNHGTQRTDCVLLPACQASKARGPMRLCRHHLHAAFFGGAGASGADMTHKNNQWAVYNDDIEGGWFIYNPSIPDSDIGPFPSQDMALQEAISKNSAEIMA
jgi:hypothetical protein